MSSGILDIPLNWSSPKYAQPSCNADDDAMAAVLWRGGFKERLTGQQKIYGPDSD